MLDLIEDHKTCGAFQCDLGSTTMCNAGYKNRDREVCKKKSAATFVLNKLIVAMYGYYT